MVASNIPAGSEHAALWPLDPEIVYLNHGSFGACPIAVLDHQAGLRDEMERNTMNFFLRRLPELAHEAMSAAADLLGADVCGLAFVNNATTGVNSVLRSLDLEPGDELIVLDHGYAACTRAAEYVAERARARVVSVPIPFPIESEDQAVEAVLEAVTDRTVLALLDHITSPTGVRLPLERMVADLRERGVESLVDGAHAPGQVALDLNALGAAYYTGNFHKWLCTPKASAFLWVREDVRDSVRPTNISHGAAFAPPRRFRAEFDWQGTMDPTPWLTIPTAIRVLSGLEPDGMFARNRRLALRARALVGEALGVGPATPDSMVAMLAAVKLPDRPDYGGKEDHMAVPPLQRALWEQYRIEIPICHWPKPGVRWVRISAQFYGSVAQMEYLADALKALLNAGE